jgi:predicted DNA-binding transcriptional regulator YafY
MLKEKRYPNYPRFLAAMKRQDIAGVYKLSARTFLRDIQFLKTEYSAPIRYDYDHRGYYLTVPDWSVDIPLLEENEMRAAVIGARMAENIMPAPIKQDVRNAVDTLLAINGKGMDGNASLLSLVAMGSRVSVKPEVFRPVFEAWQTHHCVKLVYERLMGEVSERVVEPHALVFYEGNWYLKGVTRSKNNIPCDSDRHASTLALHRIHAAEKVGEKFAPDSKIIDAVNRREVFDFPVIRDIRLRLGPEAFKFIGEQFEVIEEGREGDFHFVRIKEAPKYKIVNYILVEGGDAKLLNHPELVQEVIKRAKQVIAVQKKT